MILSAPLAPADATAAIQQALGSCGSGTGSLGETLHVPPGRYRITRTLVAQSVNGLGILGEGGRSVLLWDGPPGAPALLLSDVRQGLLADLRIVSSPSRPLAEGVRIENGSDLRVSPTMLSFERVHVDGTSDGGLGIGFRVSSAGGGGDNDNDFHAWRGCYVNHADRAWVLEPTQAHGLELEGCRAQSTGSVGVDCIGAAFHWRGGFVGSAETAFRIREYVGVPSSIEAVSVEGCGRLLDGGGPSGSAFALSLRGVRFASNSLAEDGIAIRFRYPGPMVMEGCAIGNDSSRPLTVEWDPIADNKEMVPSFTILGCRFSSNRGAGAGGLFPVRRPTTMNSSVKGPGGAVAL